MSGEDDKVTVRTDGERDREIGVLAASHASLDPNKRSQRTDILIESALQSLNDGPLTEAQVVRRLQSLWNTRSITAPLVRAALNDAKGAGLVAQQQSLFESQWVLTDEAKRDCIDDLQWASTAIVRFESEVQIRLDSDPNRVLIKDDSVSRVADSVREALSIAAEGLYALEMATDPRHLRPIRFNERAALERLATLEPRSIRNAAQRLFIAAVNPHDDFATELVHLIVAGNVLHGMVTRRDLDQRPSLQGVKLAIDTSVLVDVAAGCGDGYEAVTEAFAMSKSLGAELIVAEQTVTEWVRLFDAADAEMAATKHDTEIGALAILIDNPIIRGFATALESGEKLTWAQFRSRWREPSSRFLQLGLHVRPHGNDRAGDRELYEKIRMELGRLNRDRSDHRLRNAAALDADAESAAMVARWRRNTTKDSAYFVALDRMTGRAYKAVVESDSIPLAVTLTAWVTVAAALTTDDPRQHARCASVIQSIALRESFLALSAGYTFAEIAELAELLNADEAVLSPDDINEFLQQTLEDIETDLANVDKDDVIRLRASKLIANRAARRSQRARRSEASVEDRLRSVRTQERTAADERVDRAVQTARRDKETISREADEALTRQKRVTAVVAICLTLAGAVGALLLMGLVDSGARWAVLGCAVILVVAFCVAYLKDRAPWWVLVGVAVVAVAINVLTTVLPQAF